MPGRSEFPVKINRAGIADITNRRRSMRTLLDAAETGFLMEAPQEDFETLQTLKALIEYLQDRRVQPDFEVVLSE